MRLEEHGKFRDLLKCLLQIDPRLRPSAKDALAHPFFRDGDEGKKEAN